ncbi:MAG TPA: lipopolysaccharide biosynthesis protein, partial [Nitrobacter sp.]|nr:lipopolysaccharide biosynthesis protein [Nitrobacter sp.]
FGSLPPAFAAAPEMHATRPDSVAHQTGIDRLADDLLTAGEAARKITIMGTGENESIMLRALALARLLAHSAKVVLVDLSPSSSTLTATSIDPAAPGLADLMLGEASFGQMITRDQLSTAHLVAAGRSDADRALLQSPRLTIALDALLRVYDHVLLVAGTATDLPARLLTDQARAIVVPDPSMSADARARLSDQLTAIGFASVTMLDPAPQSPDIRTGPREAA